MRPTLPRIPRRAVNMLSVEWITKLIACIKYAMDYPKGDGKTTYRNGEAISALRQTSNALNGTPGDAYKGYFKVIKTATNKIKIVDGMDIEAAICGKVNVNYFPKNVAVIEFTITENCFIYLECELVGSPAATEATAVIIKSNTELESEAGTYRDLISRVKFAAPVAPATVGSISDFNREPVSTNVIMAGDCG